jgi:hypothetical protein
MIEIEVLPLVLFVCLLLYEFLLILGCLLIYHNRDEYLDERVLIEFGED